MLFDIENSKHVYVYYKFRREKKKRFLKREVSPTHDRMVCKRNARL